MHMIKGSCSILIISGKEDTVKELLKAVDKERFSKPCIADGGESARRILLQNCFDLVIVDIAFGGAALAIDIAECSNAGVILLTDISEYDDTRYMVEAEGIITVAKPVSAEMISTALNVLMAAHARILKIEQENKHLRFKLEEIRAVNRAKRALCENYAMDEPSAHRYIEKKAMNDRVTRYAVAKEILKELE